MKEILVCFHSHWIGMLIPKQRGDGFKQVPLGHHACPLSLLAYQIGYDIYGLDGALNVQTGYINAEDHVTLIDKAVKPISSLLGLPWRVVMVSEYWENHPCTSQPANSKLIKEIDACSP